METVEVISAEDGVTLGQAVRQGHVLYFVTCERVSGIQAFHSMEQAIQCFGLELLLLGRRKTVGFLTEGG